MPQHLLRRDVGRRSHRQPELLGEKIGKPVVAREAEIDEHRLAALAEHHVARLEVEVDDVLAVQRVKREGDLRADPCHLLGVQRRPVQPGPERVATDVLHDDVRLRREVARGDEQRNVRTLEDGQDHLLHLEADDRRGIVPLAGARGIFITRGGCPGAGDAPERGHAPPVEPLLEGVAVDHRARARCAPQPPSSSRAPRSPGRPAARIFRAARSVSYGTRWYTMTSASSSSIA